jgi:hypothetical protein
LHAAKDAAVAAERVRAPRLAVAPHQRVVVGVEKQDAGPQLLAQLPMIAGRRCNCSRSRMSTTSAARRMLGESRVSSANVSIRSRGRLSTA